MNADYDKFIAEFVDTKFESTKGMGYEEARVKIPGKQTNGDIVFYLLKDKLISCPWKH